MSTKSFIINLPIITGDQDRRRLRKSFSFGCNLQNAVMGGGLMMKDFVLMGVP